jgi:hypothetical protein
MSNNGHGSHDHGPAAGAADVVDYGKVIGVGVASLVIFALSIAVAGRIMHGAEAEAVSKTGHATMFVAKRAEIGIVDQVPFTADKRLPAWRGERKAYLDGYGWVDRSKGVVHIPIDKAVDRILAGASPAGAPK